MAYTIPTGVPSDFIKGDTVLFYYADGEFDSSADSFAVNFANQYDSQVAAGADNGDSRWLVTITAANSSKFVSDSPYQWSAVVTEAGGNVHTVERGRIEVYSDYTDLQANDARTYWEKILDAIEAITLNKASDDQSSLAVGGRSLSRYSWDELMRLRNHAEYQLIKQTKPRSLLHVPRFS